MRTSWKAIATSGLYNQHLLRKKRDKQKFAEKLNREMTKAEWALWYYLRHHGFKAQVVLFGYIPDFVNRKRKLCVELDGSAHDGEDRQERDAQRDRHLAEHGYTVIRFKNEQVFQDLTAVLARLGIKR